MGHHKLFQQHVLGYHRLPHCTNFSAAALVSSAVSLVTVAPVPGFLPAFALANNLFLYSAAFASRSILNCSNASIAVAAGAEEVSGPAQLLPNQWGGIVTAGFEERGFLDAAWKPATASSRKPIGAGPTAS